jgi:hypothetical protein
MKIDELTVEVRDSSLERVGQILPKDLVGFKAVLRFNNVGSWEITLPVGHPVGEVLRQPGSGIVVTGPTGVLMSGPTISATNEKTSSNPNGDWIIQGADDSIVLAERLAYPDPATADVEAQAEAFDARVGVASTLMLGYVDDNIGPNAPVEREIPGLSISTDPIVGSTVYPSARFDILGELLSGIASVDGLGFDIKQVDGTLEFSVFEPTDRSGQIRMDVSNNTLSKTQYAYGSHALSRAIVAGQGQGTGRQFIEVTSTDSLAAETLWGRRIETFIDQRNTADENELTQAGVEKLADGGATLTSVDVVPSSDLTMAYGKDWGLGDRVTVVIDDQEVSATVTTVSMSIDSDGVRVGATVGDASGVDYEALIAKKQTSVAQRVNSLERKEGGGLSYLHAISALNKGSLYGFSIPAGTVVMFAGSQGDVVDIVPAIADGTYPEHYLVGVTAHEIAVDAIGNVIQLGFVDHLDTSDWPLGTILYADPMTPGGFSTTPGAWGTPLAAVTRSHPQTGRLLVRCIPGGSGGGGGTGSGIVSGDTAPEDPIADMAWFDTTTGKLFIYFEDVDSGQWVEVQSSSGSDAALSTRVSTAEANINLLDSRVDVIEADVTSLENADATFTATLAGLDKRGDFAGKAGPAAYIAPYRMQWQKGFGIGTSLDWSTNSQGIVVKETGYYEVRGGHRGAENNFSALALNGDRASMETRAEGIWSHEHAGASGSNGWAESYYLGILYINEIVTFGGAANNMQIGTAGTSAYLSVKRIR